HRGERVGPGHVQRNEDRRDDRGQQHGAEQRQHQPPGHRPRPGHPPPPSRGYEQCRRAHRRGHEAGQQQRREHANSCQVTRHSRGRRTRWGRRGSPVSSRVASAGNLLSPGRVRQSRTDEESGHVSQPAVGAAGAAGPCGDMAYARAVDRPSAREFLARTVDAGTFVSWDTPPQHGALDPAYEAELRSAAGSSGADEAVLTGEARIGGHRIALVVSEFGFLGGSIGVATARRLVAAIERATALRLPLLAAPTTGGVFASWGSLGQLTLAEPGALIAFLGPRVYTALYGGEFPAGVQTAENLFAHGLLDGVVAPAELAGLVGRVLDVLAASRTAVVAAPPAQSPAPTGADPWDSITRSRRRDRPGIRRLLDEAAQDVVTLSGTGEGELDPALMLGLARFGPVPCIV